MDIKFENRYFNTEEMLREYVNVVLCRKIKIFGILIFIVGIIMMTYSLSDKNYIISSFIGISAVISIIISILTPSLTIKEIKENKNGINGFSKDETVVQFGDKIKFNEGAFSITIEYCQIKNIYDLKYTYILMLDKNNEIILSPTGFTKGTFEEFKDFINLMRNIYKKL